MNQIDDNYVVLDYSYGPMISCFGEPKESNLFSFKLSLGQTKELIAELKYAMEEAEDHKTTHNVLMTSPGINIDIKICPNYEYKLPPLP